MKTRGWKIEDGGWLARSVLECGSPLPLLKGDEPPVAAQSASHRRAEAALWRAAKAEGLAHSKTWRSFVASLVFLATAIIAHAQSYSIDWFTSDGGGVDSLSGTIGLPDAGAFPISRIF